jgi:hypothetical protein
LAPALTPIHFYRSRGGIGQAIHHPQKGRFTRPRPTDYADHAWLIDIEADRIHGRLAAECFRQLCNLQHMTPKASFEG